MKNGPLVMALVVCGVLLVGCETRRAVPDGPVTGTFTDDLGREVKVPVPMNRVVSLAPSITEMLFAAGAGDRLIGVTSYCNYPAETVNIQKVGDTLTPNIESIVALRPQVVFVSTASQLEAFTTLLTEQKIAVYVLDVKKIDDVPDRLRRLGKMFWTNEPAEKAAKDFEQRQKNVESTVKQAERPKVFLQISNEPLFTIGSDSFMTELVELAGGISLTKDITGGYPKISKETALAMDPDVIVLSDSDDNREPNTVFSNSKAVKNGRIIRVNADILSRPGPRLADALEQIAGFLNK
ncbi:ABC transporter substrate-binding protein [Leptolyngbya sp. 7M]|uniref:ABC transporter substrate-binding protein n=1 Tax=Leptolyngbya sp. 7M TaxID=2812896 RepID=UPI001B8D1C47|nr:cobalamin-binding protein [Leptolyngbya sp. 7M]QYO65675.1 cobalamin-binding protein [Leptolyngbya sp. 7M]